MKSLLLMLCCFAGVAVHAAATPDTQWTYKTINGKALKMDVFLPAGYASEELSFPAIVFYHGGGWSGGKVSWHHPDCAYWSKGGKHGILTGENLVIRPEGVEPLQPEEFVAYPQSETQINFSSPLSVYLHNNQVSETQSDFDLVIERGNTKWKGNASLSWEVEIPEKDDYEVYLIASVGEAGDGTKIAIETRAAKSGFTLFQTSGPFPGGENFSVLEAGKQVITFAISGIEKEEVLFHFRSFELLPVSKKELIAEEEARAKSARASVDWLVETGYGLMFHWTSRTPQPDGSQKTFESSVSNNICFSIFYTLLLNILYPYRRRKKYR